MPKVSVAVPNFNHARYLPARLDSVFGQTYQDYEVILLDDCSTDSSAHLLKGYANHPKVSHVICNRERVGTFTQWHRAVRMARGEYMWIAESDDIAEPRFLERLVSALDQKSSIGLAYCQSTIIDQHGNHLFDNRRWTQDLDPERWRTEFELSGRKAVRDYFLVKNVIPNASAVLFRKHLFEGLGPELEAYRYTGDWRAWIHILLASDLYYTPECLNRFRRHAATTRVRTHLADTARYINENYALVAAIERDCELDAELRARAHGVLARKLYREVGISRLFSRSGFAIVQQLAARDPELKRKLFALVLRGIRRRLTNARPIVFR